jgi:2-dehydropantoate 2-reductase
MVEHKTTPLRLLCFGAGAIGTYIGGSLVLVGRPVVFLERPEAVSELRERGLRLVVGGEERRIEQPRVAGSLNEALTMGPFDVAIFAVKSYDTRAVLESLVDYQAALPAFLCLQNGVENEQALASVLGNDRVIAGSVTSSVTRRGPGDIVLERFRGVGIAGSNPVIPALFSALLAAGLNVRIYPDAASLKWSKMLTNLLANATSAILNLTPAQVFADGRLFRLEMRQLKEVLQVMAAQGISVVDLPGVPVSSLSWAVRSLPSFLARPVLARAVGGGRGAKMPSFHIDLHAGRGKSEVEFLNGAVVRAGDRLGIPTPVNRVLTDTLMALTRGELPLEKFDHRPEALLERMKDEG